MTTTTTAADFIAKADATAAELALLPDFTEDTARTFLLGFTERMLDGTAQQFLTAEQFAEVRNDFVDALAAHWGIQR